MKLLWCQGRLPQGPRMSPYSFYIAPFVPSWLKSCSSGTKLWPSWPYQCLRALVALWVIFMAFTLPCSHVHALQMSLHVHLEGATWPQWSFSPSGLESWSRPQFYWPWPFYSGCAHQLRSTVPELGSWASAPSHKCMFWAPGPVLHSCAPDQSSALSRLGCFNYASPQPSGYLG